MKKNLILLIIAAISLAGCKTNTPEEPKTDIEKYIVGKWKLFSYDGKAVPTNDRIVYTFAENGAGTQTLSSISDPVSGASYWYAKKEISYEIQDNAIFTSWNNTSVNFEWLANISAISADSFATEPSRMFENKAPKYNVPASVWRRVTADYAEDIIGLWEGVSSESGVHGDEHHRWLFDPNGSYMYLDYQDGEWIASENTLNEYVVDGDFLAFLWKENPQSGEKREWWDITITDDTLMNWSGIRLREDGTAYESKFTLRRVSPLKKDIEKLLIGKWIVEAKDGQKVYTNEKSVHTFLSNGTVDYTIASAGEAGGEWFNKLNLKYSLYGNYLVESGKDPHGKVVEPYRSHFNAISDTYLDVMSMVGRRMGSIQLRRVSDAEDCTTKILGLWEGVESSGGDFGDGNHRWEYFEDGTYNYYNFENGEWKAVASNNGQYLVDGTWLACRWTNSETGNMDYEWWDISINGDTMRWDALRNHDGKAETQYFIMKRIK